MTHDNYDDWQKQVDKRTAAVWQANGGGLAFDPASPELGVTDLMAEMEGSEEDLREARLLAFRGLMDFLWAAGPNPVLVLKRLFVVTRCCSPQHLAFMSQTDVSVLLNETRAATQAREKKQWEKLLLGCGFFGTRNAGKKGDQARAKYSDLQKGNASRRGGKKAQRKYSALRQKRKGNGTA